MRTVAFFSFTMLTAVAYASNGEESDTISLLQMRAVQTNEQNCDSSGLGKDCCPYGEFRCAPGHSMGDYALGTIGLIDCPAGYAYVNDESECKTAASTYEVNFGVVSSPKPTLFLPTGCISNWPSVNQVQWVTSNGWSYGWTQKDTRRVCKKSSFTLSEVHQSCPVGYGMVDDRPTCIGSAMTELGYEWGGDYDVGYLPNGCVNKAMSGPTPDRYVAFNTGGHGVQPTQHSYIVCQATTTTTTTTIMSLNGLDADEKAEEVADEQSNTYECAKFCHSKKHANKPWIGKKCDWYACRNCEECTVR